MIRNYLITAIRSFLRSNATSLINFIGLTVGLICTIIIFINVNHELSYDRFHEKKDRIFRILSIDNALGVSNNVVGITIPALAQGMKNEIPEVEEIVRISPVGKALVKYNDNSIYSEDLIFTEPSFFEVFDFRLKKGDITTCIKSPNTAVLTETMAKKITRKALLKEPDEFISFSTKLLNLRFMAVCKNNWPSVAVRPGRSITSISLEKISTAVKANSSPKSTVSI